MMIMFMRQGWRKWTMIVLIYKCNTYKLRTIHLRPSLNQRLRGQMILVEIRKSDGGKEKLLDQNYNFQQPD